MVYFDFDAFYDDIDSSRCERGLHWKAVGQQAGVCESTLTRFKNGKTLSVDNVAKLSRWLNVGIDAYVKET